MVRCGYRILEAASYRVDRLMIKEFAPGFLTGRRLVCTGASSGIGRRFAIRAAEHGASVILVGRDQARLAETMQLMPAGDHETVVLDMTNSDTVNEWLQGAGRRVGGLDGVFHSAGNELIRPLRMTKQEHFDACFGASVFGALGICRAAASKDTFRSAGGAVVLMSSVAGLRGQVGMSAYSTTKAAVDGLVRSAALELAPKAIRVSSIAAGGVKTEMHERITGKLDAASNDAYAARHPLGLGDPDDVVGLGLFLISALGRWMTGATIVMDGGYCTR